MSDTPSANSPLGPEKPETTGKLRRGRNGRGGRRKRRGMRIALLSALSVAVLLGAAVGGALAVISNLAGNVHRIDVTRLAAVGKPAGGPAGQAMNVLITGQDRPGGKDQPSGLIIILHINASQQAGGVVSIHPLAQVQVPAHGRTEIQNALVFGGPSLLVQTVSQLTGVAIQHYARIDLPHVASLIDTMGGVDVATSSGTQHFTGRAALRYARDPAVDEEGRVLRQQALLRAVMIKLADQHLLTNMGVLNSLTSMLTVDSDFSNSQLLALARDLQDLSASAGTFVLAPYFTAGSQVFLRPAASHSLWAAIMQDAIAAWARAHPRWVTPEVVP